MERILENVYYNLKEPGSYGGVNQLAKNTGLNVDKTRDWLTTQDTYTLHKPVRYKFKRRRTYSKHVNDLVQMDLVDLQSLARDNDSHRFILTAIDVFSRKAYAEPLKAKSAQYMVPAITRILDQIFPRVNLVQTDRGLEFLNKDVQQLFRDRNIKHYWSFNDEIKASVVERWNRTLKSKMHKYFTHNNTHRWIDVLQSLVENYNNTCHRTIKMAPNQVSDENASLVRDRLYPSIDYKPKWKYQIGQKCRISKFKHVFHKGYRQGWSNEIFVIRQRFATDPVTYGLEDLLKEELAGKFYEEEIQPVTKEEDGVYKVEKILKSRRNKQGEIEYLVRWQGYSSKFDSWVSSLQDA